MTTTAVPARTFVPGLRSRGLAAAGNWGYALCAAFVLIGAVYPLIPGLTVYLIQVGFLVFWWASVGTSWSIVGGYGGMHSIGHAAFIGAGAYTSTLLFVDFGVSPWLGMPAGMLVAAALAVAIGYPCFRFGIRGDYFALVTVALGEVALEFADSYSSLTKGSQGIVLPFTGNSWARLQFDGRRIYYWIAMALWLVVIVVAYRIRRSRFGYRLIAIRDDEVAASRGGISVTKNKLAALAISAAIAAAAGTLYAQFFLFIDPQSVFGLNLSVELVLIAIFGGLNSYLGATLGALVLIPLQQYLSATLSSNPGIDLAIYGAVLVALMLFLPGGILGTSRRSARWRQVVEW